MPNQKQKLLMKLPSAWPIIWAMRSMYSSWWPLIFLWALIRGKMTDLAWELFEPTVTGTRLCLNVLSIRWPKGATQEITSDMWLHPMYRQWAAQDLPYLADPELERRYVVWLKQALEKHPYHWQNERMKLELRKGEVILVCTANPHTHPSNSGYMQAKVIPIT